MIGKLIAQHGAGAVDLETTPNGVGELDMKGPVLAHANHFKSRYANVDGVR